MLILVSGATKTVRRYSDNKHLGCLLTPDTGNRIETMNGLPWAADNAAFSNFKEEKFIKMLDKIKGSNPLFVTAPDVVADAEQTISLFEKWQPIIKSYGLKAAFVLQDGQESLPVPWKGIDAVFIGGTTEWKLGRHAYNLVKEAKKRGIWVHMGRVNSNKRLEYARDIGCDSVDGTGYSMFPDKRIPKALEFLELQQLTLFEKWEVKPVC
jgi:hypothetical protein